LISNGYRYADSVAAIIRPFMGALPRAKRRVSA
jgi:hypothetical protein